MKRCFHFSLTAVALAGALSLVVSQASRPVSAQSRATAPAAASAPVIPWEAVPNFFKNPPGIYTGENMGISTSSKGNIYIYHRANETRLFEYAPNGNFIREIGRGNYGFAFAHSEVTNAPSNRFPRHAHHRNPKFFCYDSVISILRTGRLCKANGRYHCTSGP